MVAGMDSGSTRLLQAMEGEMRLLRSLGVALTRMDDALQAGDGNAVDEAVYAVHRVTRTLLEARRRREVLIEIEQLRGGGIGFPMEIRAALARLVESSLALDAQIRGRCCALQQIVTSRRSDGSTLSRPPETAQPSGGAG